MSSFLITVPLIVFLIFVAPLWLFLHYRSKRKSGNDLSTEDLERLNVLSERAESMQDRVKTLEKILDVESPNWRRDYK